MRFPFPVWSRPFLAVLAAAYALVPGSIGAAGKSSTMATNSSVEITITPWMDNLPRSGMVPVTVQISNKAPQDRVWEFTSKENDYRAGDMTGHFVLGVPAGGTATSTFLMNTLPDVDASARGYKNLNITVSGPGVMPGMGVYLNATAGPGVASGSKSGSKFSPYIVWGEQFDLSHRKTFKTVLEDQMHVQWQGDTVSMPHAPLDWRGYTGVAQVWIADTEWAAISEAQRQALLTWVGTGGAVFVITSSAEARPALPQGLAWKDQALSYGAGGIRVIQQDNVGDAVSKYVGGKSSARQLIGQPGGLEERLAALVPPLTLRGKLIFSFILVFGVMVGPVNLFWFARGGNRPRLFWTTPLISFVGAAVLVAVMLMQDGTGGAGARVLLATMLPQQKQMVVTQEQYSKTGVLLGRSFNLPEHEAAWLVPLPITRKVESRYSGYDERVEKRSYDLADRQAGGGWFSSRALQAQLIQSVRLNRGGIDLKEGASPTVVSSLGSSLARLYVMDSQKKLWTAERVATGQRSTLTPASTEDFDQWLRTQVKTHMGNLMRAQVDASIPADGPWFFAEAAEPAKLALPTLDSIRWDHDRAYLAGPAAADSTGAQ